MSTSTNHRYNHATGISTTNTTPTSNTTVNNRNNMISYDNVNSSDYTSYFQQEDTFGLLISPLRGQKQLKLSAPFRRRQSAPSMMNTDHVTSTIQEQQGLVSNATALLQTRNNILNNSEPIPESASLDNWPALNTIGTSLISTANNDPFTKPSYDLLRAQPPPSPGLIARLTGLFSYRNDSTQNEMLSASAVENNANVTDFPTVHGDMTNNHNNNIDTQNPTDHALDSAPISYGFKDYFTRRKASITTSDLNAYAPISQ